VAPAGGCVDAVGPTATIRSPWVITVVCGSAPSRSIGITVASTNATTGASAFVAVPDPGSGFGGDGDDDLPQAARATSRARPRTAAAYSAPALLRRRGEVFDEHRGQIVELVVVEHDQVAAAVIGDLRQQVAIGVGDADRGHRDVRRPHRVDQLGDAVG